MQETSELSQSRIWILAARPKTLPAAAAPVIVGAAVAFYEGVFSWGPVLAALLGALLLQIGSNLANDLFDFQKGADVTGRLGPMRVTQTGLRSPTQMKIAMIAVFGLAALAGVYLIAVAGWPILIVGLLAIASAVAYTGGPFPLGYHGLGELFVFLFFGLAAVCGTYYVQAGSISSLAWWSAVPVGLLVTAILVVNNLRDVESDRVVGKRTMAVRLGVQGTRREYLILVQAAYLLPALMWALKVSDGWVVLSWLSFPLAATQAGLITRHQGRVLNLALAGTAQLALVYSLLYSAGLVVARLI